MEGKTQLSGNLGALERELISPPAANYCHEIKWFVLFGERQQVNGKTKAEKAQMEKKKIKHRAVTAGICLQDHVISAERKGRLLHPAGGQTAQFRKRQLGGGKRARCRQLGFVLKMPEGEGDILTGSQTPMLLCHPKLCFNGGYGGGSSSSSGPSVSVGIGAPGKYGPDLVDASKKAWVHPVPRTSTEHLCFTAGKQGCISHTHTHKAVPSIKISLRGVYQE